MEDEINLLEIWQTLKKYMPVIGLITLLSTIGFAFYTKTIPNTYRANAILLPLDQQPKGSSALAASGLGNLPFSSMVGLNSSGKIQLISFLSSRSLAEAVISQDQNRIYGVLFPGLWDPTTQKWLTTDPKEIPQPLDIDLVFLDHINIDSDPKKPTIEISAEFTDRLLAVDIVNGYIKALQKYLKEHTLTDAKKNLAFIESSLEQKQKELLESGKELSKFYEANLISKFGAAIDVDASVGAQDEAQTIVKGVPQSVFFKYLTAKQTGLAAMTNFLASEYEKARITENKESIAFQVIDPPLVPTRKSGPHRAQWVLLYFGAHLFFLSLCALAWDHLKKKKSLPA